MEDSPILEQMRKDREGKKSKKSKIPILGITIVIIAIASICFLSYHALDKLLPDVEKLYHPFKTESKEVIKPIESVVKPSQIEKSIYVRSKDAVHIKFDFEVKAHEYNQMKEFDIKMKELKITNIIRNVLKDYTVKEFYRNRNLEKEIIDKLPSDWKFKKYVLPAQVTKQIEHIQQAKYEIEMAKIEAERMKIIAEAMVEKASKQAQMLKIEHELKLIEMIQEREIILFKSETDKLVKEIRGDVVNEMDRNKRPSK